MKIFARDTSFKKVDNDEALVFTELNHRQGISRPGGKIRSYGLYSKSQELLAVAIFCNPRTSGMQKRYTTELLRLTFKENVRIVGGASKLIKNFITTENPWDFFTYQSTEGEATELYSFSSMTLIGPSAPKAKSVLVRNGVTRATALDNHRDWLSLEQATRLGPDALLGTTIGEKFHETGQRFSNIQLFLDLGYHLENVPGDRIYEWRNPYMGFYTYRITSSKDQGYYIGRRTLKGNPLTLDDCLKDSYLGSGGEKFKNWVSKVGLNSLSKEIIGIYSKWSEAVANEKALIGNLYKDDPNCKNTKPGGVGLSTIPTALIKKECSSHGETYHRGKSCMKCSSASATRLDFCDNHGYTIHMGSSCKKCAVAKTWSKELCSIHGLTNFRKDRCEKCAAEKRVTIKLCPIHGETKHQGQTCSKCSTVDVHQAECPIHGFSNFRGDRCLLCVAQKSWVLKACALHGTTLHIGDFCKKCQTDSLVNERECKTHGLTAHLGNACAKCSKAATTMKECVVHGPTKHLGDYCFSCGQARQLTWGLCPVHGEVKLQHGKCTTCSAAEKFSLKNCPSHGESKHIGDKCSKCVAGKVANVQICPIHGSTAHSGKSCRKCISDRGSSLKNCPKHGLVKHRGERCARCSSEKTAHRRFHLKKPNPLCVFCEDEKH